MKKLIMFSMILVIAISPLFRGLFFNFEASLFLTLLSMLSFTYFMIKLAKKEAIFFNKWLLFFGILLVAAYSLAFIKAVNIRQNIAALLQVTGYLVISVVLYDYYYDKKEKFCFYLMFTTVISGFINAVIGIEAITGVFRVLNDTLNDKRVGGTFQYANTAAIYFAICIIFSLTLMYTVDKPVFRILLTGVSNTLLLALLLTRSRGGYIIGFTAILLLFVIQGRGYKFKTTVSFICAAIPALLLMQKISALTASQDALSLTKLMIISIVGALLLALGYEGIVLFFSRINKNSSTLKIFTIIIPILLVTGAVLLIFFFKDKLLALIPQNIIERFAQISFTDKNVFLRLTFDKDALKLIAKHWLLGVGGGGWAVLYYGIQDFLYISRAAHNHYFEVFVEAGILGFISFTTTVVMSLFYSLYGLIKSKETEHRVYLAGILSSLLAMTVHSSFDFDFSFVSLALLFWVMSASSAAFLPEKIKNKNPIKKYLISESKGWAILILIICSSVLFSFNGLYTIAACSAEAGLDYKTGKDYLASVAHYEEANRLDPLNSNYTYELTKIYNYFADISEDKNNIDGWRNAARNMAERSILLNQYLPENNRILIRTYFNLGMPLEALEYAKKLVKYQPCDTINYELLTQGYLESGKYYLEQENYEKTTELLEDCLKVDPFPYSDINESIIAYKEEASKLLENN